MGDPGEAEEQGWCEGERARVIEYLERQGLVHGELGEWPAWHIWPYVAVWAVESVKRPGWVGWWAISGDLPTDYASCGPERHPREGLRDIATRWKETADKWNENEPRNGSSIGTRDSQSELAQLLARRADLLLSYAENDDLWLDG